MDSAPMDSRSDADLITASREGDTRAFAVLVERHQTMACAVTYSATGDRSLSEDLAQEAFILAWRRLGDLDEPERFRPWLCGVARNLARNATRKRRHEVAIDDPSRVRADAPSPADMMSERQQEHAMWQALEQIPETYREPLVLFYREGHSARQVAAALGISSSAVEQRLSRGRKHLREGVREVVATGLARAATPAAGFAASVMAGIAALPATAQAAGTAAAASGPGGADPGRAVPSAPPRTSSPASSPPAKAARAASAAVPASLLPWVAGGLGLAAVAIAATWLSTDDTAPAPESSAAATAPSSDHSARHGEAVDAEALAEQATLDERRVRAAAEDREAALARLPLPASAEVAQYQLSELGRKVAVDLDGGTTGLSVFPGRAPSDPPPVVRHWRGRAVDSEGAPVAGTVVIAGSHLRKLMGNSIVGSAGAVTDEDGRFSIPLSTADAVSGLAMRSGKAWSSIVPLGAGETDVERDIQIVETASVHGRITRGGQGVAASISLGMGGGGLRYVTQPDGRFVIAPIPPGSLEVLAREGVELGLAGAHVERTVSAAPGQEVKLDIELPVGSLLAFDVVPPADVAFDTISFYTLRGEHRLADRDAMKAAYDAAPADDRRYILHGGIDRDDPAQLPDMPEGPATACVVGEAIPRDETGLPVRGRSNRTVAFFQCRVVEVAGPGTVTPVELSPPPA